MDDSKAGQNKPQKPTLHHGNSKKLDDSKDTENKPYEPISGYRTQFLQISFFQIRRQFFVQSILRLL